MPISPLAVSLDDWLVNTNALCAIAREDVLLRSSAFLGWPDPSGIATWLKNPLFLSSLPRQGAEQIDSSDTPIPTDKKATEIISHKKKCALWWAEVMEKSGLTITGLRAISPPVFEYLSARKELHSALVPLIHKTPKDELEKWLTAKSSHEVDHSNAYDKCSILGMFVKLGSTEMLSSLSEVLSSWPTMLDKKSRTPLFYARSAAMVSFLIDQGVDPHHVNSEGQTAPSFWSEAVQSKNVPLWLGVWGEKSPSITKNPTEDSMMMKWSSLSPSSFTPKEQANFQAHFSLPASTPVYTGRLFGIERSWTLSEAWCLGELQKANSYTSLNSQASRHQGSGGPIIGDASKFFKEITNRRSALSSDVSTALRLNDTPDKTDLTMGQRILRWLVQAHHPDVKSSPTELWNFSPNFQSWQSDNVRKYNTIMVKQSCAFIASLTADEKVRWSQDMAPFWSAPWLYSALGQQKLQPVITTSSLPVSLGGLATSELAASWSLLLQDEGVRNANMVTQWFNSAEGNWKKHWSSQNSGNTEEWAPVLRIALCLLGAMSTYSMPNQRYAELAVVDMIDANVPMDKVPWRWAKNYGPELKARVDKWIIEKTIEKSAKHQKAAAIAPSPARRRM